MKAVNLLPDRPRGGRSFGIGRVPLVAAGAVAVVAGAGLWGWSATQGVDAVRQDVVAATSERDALQSRLGAYQDADARLAEVRARRGDVAAIGAARTNWERMIRDLAGAMPRSVSLTNLRAELSPSDGAAAGAAAAGAGAGAPTGMHLEGEAPDHRTVARVMVRTASVRGLGEPYLTSSQGDSETGRVSFVIDLPVDQRAQDRSPLTPVAAPAAEVAP